MLVSRRVPHGTLDTLSERLSLQLHSYGNDRRAMEEPSEPSRAFCRAQVVGFCEKKTTWFQGDMAKAKWWKM